MAVAARAWLGPAEEQFGELELTTGLLVQDDDEEDDLDDDDEDDSEGDDDEDDDDYRRWDENRPGWSD